ncbi:MAG: transcriptional regulator NrdR [Bdellovibrio sp. CG12_big_fil_rev_8_21_14_0_65_39_13]|nr:MAG: transcriptional regulator NrdR [Bdellovibrio sp. CG22_combo_CG10-13_8_21_14_all_39_27]PIQ59792.1 MAG: transcriptional regulator NrdR [Bdellovibrio sp. CG12_big_fil_rev_8_21_14_0_65_39_13]PIR36180.1 MAG: transcriptional regulator NrdR [Bdellovibrio sp. CG11_big_fil_rev_8_21_14_0_20_39_38]
MYCPTCHHQDTKVIDTRIFNDGLSIRRRRKCEACEKRFTTYENVELETPTIVKHDGRREAFNGEKILKGLSKACQKRPISSEDIHSIIESVKKTISEIGSKEVPSKLIGEIVMENLHHLDPVAFVRFASFYWDFKDINGFVKTLQNNKLIEKEDNHVQ